MRSRREFMSTTAKGITGAALMGALASARTANAAEAKPAGPAGAAKQSLVDVLKAVGKPTEQVTMPDGTTVLLLPYGGRVLGAFAPGSDENFYWTNTALNSVETAKAFYASDEWQNSGGDRTWLAPEIDIFFPNFPDRKKYWQPRELDPGTYEVKTVDGNLQLRNHLTITLSRTKQQVELEMAKWVTPAPNPFRYERDIKLDGIEYAGYTQHTTLEMLGDSAKSGAVVGLWNLIQMPNGGDLLVPTYSRTQPQICFGDIAPDDLVVEPHLIRYKMRAKGEQKINIRALSTTGRVGYLYQTGEKWALVMRNYFVNPSGEYVDAPWSAPDDLGYATQGCNVNSGLGSFSELEYHIPAIGKKTGSVRCQDAAQVWAFRGSQEQIMTVAHALLSSEV